MVICEFCLQYGEDGKCWLGLNVPRQMSCREFTPGIQRFCSDPHDFVSVGQIVQMATFFGIKGTELKKVKLMAGLEEETRSKPPVARQDSLTTE